MGVIRLPSFGPQLFMRRNRGGISLDADALTLFAAMSSEPDATRKTLISDTIVALKDAGIWDELDEMWFLAAHAEQAALLGWKRYKDCVAVNAPTFTTDEGFAGDGSTSYLNTQFVLSTDGVQYTLNDASFGVYSRTDLAAGGVAMGAGDDGANRTVLNTRNPSDKFAVVVNTGASQAEFTNSDGRGLFVARRVSSTSVEGWRNGASLGSATQDSSALPDVAVFIGAENSNGTAKSFIARQYAFAFVGAAMTEGQQEDLYEIVQDYMTAIGANV